MPLKKRIKNFNYIKLYRFFGQIDGTIMDSLVQDRIYRRIALKDYQGVCSDSNNPYSAAHKPRPIQSIAWLVNYFFTVATTWLAMVPYPIHAWSHSDNTEYSDLDDDTVYPDDYEEENISPNENDHSEEITVQPVSVL